VNGPESASEKHFLIHSFISVKMACRTIYSAVFSRSSFINAAARLIAGLRLSHHITDTQLASFHWLRAPERIKFTLAVIVYLALHGTAPRYLSEQLCWYAGERSSPVVDHQSSWCQTITPCHCW